MEDQSHLFYFHCPFTTELWKAVLIQLKVQVLYLFLGEPLILDAHKSLVFKIPKEAGLFCISYCGIVYLERAELEVA